MSRIPHNSEDLKTLSILKVNTRSMTQSLQTSKQSKDVLKPLKKIDHLAIWETDSSSEVRKFLKVSCEVHHNKLSLKLLNHNYRKILGQIIVPVLNNNGSQALEFAFLQLSTLMSKYNRNMLAISKEDNMFKNMSIETFKEIANTAISNYQIILFTPPIEEY